MFNLEQAIREWRQRMAAAGLQSPVLLEELEGHLREEIERQVKAGRNEARAFEMAVADMGPPAVVYSEFAKVPGEVWSWNQPMLWVAWGTFAFSFCLPACGQLWGWQCAVLAATAFWPGTFANWLGIHCMLITLANLFMLASPFWRSRFAGHPRAMQRLRWASVAALGAVWSYLGLWVFESTGSSAGLKAGCYLWALSFGWFAWSALPKHKHRIQYV